LNPERVGRDGYLRLQFERRGRSTVLAQSRFTLPLQALTPFEMADGTSYLMLLNPTGGVLGGDHLVTEIIQESGTHVCLTTPSATRIYRTSQQSAVLETVIKLGDGATLEYLPDHVIPHIGSALRQSLRVEMGCGSRAIVLDSLASGRVAHGERWSFTELDSQTEVFSRGKPEFLNRTKIEPAGPRHLRQIAWMKTKNFDYLTSMGVFADGFENWQRVVAAMNAELDSMPQVLGGVSLLSHGSCVIRYMARSASEMIQMNKKLWDAARELVVRLPRFDHRKY
jgi:urease accessory protein